MSLTVYVRPDPDDTTVALVYDDGDGGIYIIEHGYTDMTPVSSLEGDWIKLQPPATA